MDPFIAIALISNLGTGIVGWIIVGLLAGWLGHVFAHAASRERVVDVALGLVGAAVGGGLFGVLMTGTAGLWGSLAVAFASGLAFAWIASAVSERSTR